MADFPKLVEECLVMEHNRTPEEAAALVKKHSQIVVTAIMNGISFRNVHACAGAIEIKESDEKDIRDRIQ